MQTPAANLPALLQWFLIGYWLLLGSTALSACIVVWVKWDRWMVSRRGIPGTGVVITAELVRTLPQKMWEVRIEVVPADIPNLSYKRTVRWLEREFADQAEILEPGTKLQLRFRRFPRPLIMPMNIAT